MQGSLRVIWELQNRAAHLELESFMRASIPFQEAQEFGSNSIPQFFRAGPEKMQARVVERMLGTFLALCIFSVLSFPQVLRYQWGQFSVLICPLHMKLSVSLKD